MLVLCEFQLRATASQSLWQAASIIWALFPGINIGYLPGLPYIAVVQ